MHQFDPHVVAADVGVMNERHRSSTRRRVASLPRPRLATPALKDIAGKVAYLVAAHGRSSRRLRSTCGCSLLRSTQGAGSGAQLQPVGDSTVRMFAVCNAPFIGGGYAIAPDALINDGLFDAIVVPRMPLLELLATLQRIASAGDPGRADVLSFRSAHFDLVSIAAPGDIDGEVLEVDRCAYRVLRRRLVLLRAEPLAASVPFHLPTGNADTSKSSACGP